MKGSGIFTVQVDGQEVGLRFGMLSTSYTEEISGKTIYQIFKEIATGRATPMLQYFYGGLMAHNYYAKNGKTVDLGDAALLIDRNPDECARVYAESIKIYTDGEAQQSGEPVAA